MTTTIPTTAQVAASLERAARVAAPFIAFSVTAIILLAELSYAAGYQLGTAVHQRNDQLAALWRRLWTAEPEVLAEPTAEPIQPATVPPAPHPLALLATDLEELTCRQLRELTGCRSKRSKRELIGWAVAC